MFDVSGDGVITKEELTKILRANHMAGSDKEVQKKAETILAQADTDGDGVVSWGAAGGRRRRRRRRRRRGGGGARSRTQSPQFTHSPADEFQVVSKKFPNIIFPASLTK